MDSGWDSSVEYSGVDSKPFQVELLWRNFSGMYSGEDSSVEDSMADSVVDSASDLLWRIFYGGFWD